MVLVGTIAALVVSVGFNYFAYRTTSTSAAPVFEHYFVAAQGNDNNDGTAYDKAFRTFDKAIAVVNKVPAAAVGRVTLYVGGNVYMTASTVTLTRNDILIVNYDSTLGRSSISQLNPSTAVLLHSTTFRIASASNVQLKDVKLTNIVIDFSRAISNALLDRVSVYLEPTLYADAPMLDISGGSARTPSKNVTVTNSSFTSMAKPRSQSIQSLVNIKNANQVLVKGNTFDAYHDNPYVAFTLQNCDGVTVSSNTPSGTPANNRYWKYYAIDCKNASIADDENTID